MKETAFERSPEGGAGVSQAEGGVIPESQACLGPAGYVGQGALPLSDSVSSPIKSSLLLGFVPGFCKRK